MFSFVSRGRRRNIAERRGLLWFWGAGVCFYLLLAVALMECNGYNGGRSEGDDETKWCRSAWSLSEFQPQPKSHDHLDVDLLVEISRVPGGALTNSVPMCCLVCLPTVGNFGLWNPANSLPSRRLQPCLLQIGVILLEGFLPSHFVYLRFSPLAIWHSLEKPWPAI